jgi:hypothetical protein
MRWALSIPVALACVLPAFGLTPAEKKQTVAYLHSLAAKNGGYRPSAAVKSPTLGGTLAAFRALKYLGDKPEASRDDKVFVLSGLDDSGGFADPPGEKSAVIPTAVGLMAMVDLGIPTKVIEGKAIAYLEKNAKTFEEVRMAAAALEAVGKRSAKNADWIAELKKRQNPDGTFGKGDALPRETGGAVACLLRLGGKIDDPKAVTRALDKGQNDDGGFSGAGAKTSDLGTTYRVVRTYHMLKAKPARSDDLRRFIAKCRNKDGGYGVAPGSPSSAGGTYYASIVLHWLDTK